MSNKELSNEDLVRSLLRQNEQLITQNELLVRALTTSAGDMNDPTVVNSGQIKLSEKAQRRQKRYQQSSLHRMFPTFSYFAKKIHR